MIKLDKYAEHTFLNYNWARKIIDNGIDMSDAVWFIIVDNDEYFIASKHEKEDMDLSYVQEVLPTYTIADILYKLNEYPYVDECGASLGFIKDAPFYMWTYYFKNNVNDPNIKLPRFTNGQTYLESLSDTPLESAACMLILCKENNIRFWNDANMKYEEDDYMIDDIDENEDLEYNEELGY